MNSLSDEYKGEDIAIIGIAGRFPGADDIEGLWENIKNGVESVELLNDEDLKKANVDPALYNDPNYVKAAAVIKDIELFDAQFFGFNPREAEVFNPQHRMFLECAWEALESAGYNPEAYNGRIGVYGGEGFNSYLMDIASNPDLARTLNEIQVLIGNDKDFLATLVSYKLNLKGPSMTVQSGCSTSLLAISLACQGLRSYQCDIALAGGIRLGIPQKTGYLYKEGSILSPDGHCKPFDEKADGTVGGSGSAIVGLKRLEDALEGGDYIYAVIKGTAVNNDGSLKIGYTAPSIDGQAEAIFEALEVGGVSPETIGYVETHGTGTVLGDPIEFDALNKVFGSTEKKGFCALGSVKANMGHLDAAAGATGVIKTALVLKNGIIPPCVNFKKPNPKIKLDESPFYIPTEAAEWKTRGALRRAGVSSFGIGGTNVHAVLEEAPLVEGSPTSKAWHIVILSARSEKALEDMTANLAVYFSKNPEGDIADAAYTLQNGRKAFDFRKAVVCGSTKDAAEIMSKPYHERLIKGSGDISGKSIVFMFPGQGSQYVNMGLELYQTEKVFREQVDLCSRILEPHLGLDLRKILYPGREEDVFEQINQTYLAQPALFTIEYALARALIKYGVMPRAMIGHSIGEYVAACIAGVFSLEEVLPLIAARGRMMQGQPHGVMTSVSAREEDVEPLLSGEVSIAVINSPDSCVISGPEDKVIEIELKLEEKSIGFVRLHTSHAFHSQMMDSIIGPFTEKVGKVKLNAPSIPVISNVTGTWLKDEDAKDPGYWARHLAGTVKFSHGIKELISEGAALLIEVGPGNTLCTLTKQQTAENKASRTIATMRHPRHESPDTAVLYCALGKLWGEGVQVNWSEMYKDERRLRIPLPTYPFERQRYWIEPDRQVKKAAGMLKKMSKNPEVSEWLYTPYWKPTAPVGDYKGDASGWLIFADECGLTGKIASRLKNKGNEVTIVFQGEKYDLVGDREYSLNPCKSGDYAELFSSILAVGKLPERIIHMWCVGDDEKEIQNRGFYSLINIAKALGKLNITDRVKISVITSNMQETGKEKKLYPEKATVLGACRVIPQEYINISCASIDITLPTSSRQGDCIADSIINETGAAVSEYAAAYRGNTRWIQDFERLKPDGDNVMSCIRKEGVYLITGGLGNIGLIFAEYLAKEYRARLVLVGRSEFPAKDGWEQWLASNGTEDETSRKILKLKQMENMGGEVLIYSGDASSEEQMREVVSGTKEKFGAINGVIHAAGVVGEKTYNSVQELDKSKIEEQFKSKIHGTRILAKVLKDMDIDFCLLASSLSSVLGGLGLTAYSAANLFMDAFAAQCNREGDVPWISVDWDGWAFSDKVESPDGLYIAPEEGTKALKLILSQGMMTNIVVSTGDLKHRIDRWVMGGSIKGGGLKQGMKGAGDRLEHKIAYIWSDLLGIEQVGVNDDFFELGGNSLLVTQAIYRMRAELHLDMPIKEFFETPTVGGIVEKIEKNKDKEKKIAEALDMVKALSKTQVQKLLEEVKGR